MLLLFSICRLLFFLFNRNLFPDISADQFWTIFIGGLRFDVSALAWGNIAYIVLFIIPLKFRYNRYYQSVLKYLFIVVNSILMAANCIDIIYFRFTLRRTTAGVFQEFAGEQNYFSLALQFLIDYWYIFLIWVALICLLVLFYQKAKKPLFKNNLRNSIFFYSISTIALVVIALLCVAGMRGGLGRTTRPITLGNAGEYVKRPLEAAIVQNTPFCIFRTLDKKNLS
ncbi:MAG: LTA synthase family protein, partial [Prevotellaceae bacterium]|nr:LTA synthase family protein [Prevotellaceae bacterium]